jgi:hypothetical protein
MLLYIALVIYIIIMVLATLFKFKYLYMVAGLLWLIPLVELDNAWIKLVSVIVFIVHIILGLYSTEESEF